MLCGMLDTILKGSEVTMFKDYSFTKRLAMFLAIDVAISLLDSFIPSGLQPVKNAISLVELTFMAMTMGIALREVLADF
jgi:hypothetical protein